MIEVGLAAEEVVDEQVADAAEEHHSVVLHWPSVAAGALGLTCLLGNYKC